MTFVEAAIEILKREGKPLSTRRLAELAVKHNLLSVVGRDPEATMQERLDDALEHVARHPDLVRVKADTFGLHAYPPRPYPVNGTQAHEEAGGEKRGRRRRGRRDDDVEGVDETEAAAADEGEAGAEGEAAEGAAAPAAAEGAAEAGAPAGEKRRRRRRGGRGRRRRQEGEAATSEAAPAGAGSEAEAEGEAETEAPAVPDELPLEAAAAGTPPEEVAELEAAAEEAELLEEAGAVGETTEPDEELVDEEIDEHTGPLLAPSLGAEDVTRTEDDRTVRPEILGSRDERRRHDRHRDRRERHKERKGHEAKGHEAKGHEAKGHEGRGHEHRAHEHRAHEHKGHEHKAHEHKAHEHKAHEHKAHEHEHRPQEPRPSVEPRTGGLVDTLLDLLRASDGRPTHVRHLVDTALKRRAVDDKTPAGELVRLARAALVREQRDREADGLRPRVRPLGGGHYGTVDKKLDPELLQAERELGSSAGRLRDATRAAVRRRLGRMAPAAFDALGRTLADKLGVTGLELLRRGEGVTYWGGSWTRGVAATRVLIALRPGEGEINRRAVGELRAGLAAKGYDEGLLLGAGRPNAEALAELKQGGVTLYDGAALAGLLIKHGLGVRRVAMPVEYLDLDFFGELNEG